MKLLKDQGEIFKLFDSLSSVSELSAEERIAYWHDLKIYRDNLMFEEQEKRHIEEAEKRGREKGREEARMEALRHTAKYFLSINMPVDQIARGTGLDIEQIEEIKKSMA